MLEIALPMFWHDDCYAFDSRTSAGLESKQIMKRMLMLSAALIGTAIMAVPAAAVTLAGNVVGIQYYFPSQVTLYQDLGTNLVGTDGATDGFGVFDLSFADTTISAGFQQTTSWTPAEFNGFRVSDVNGTIAAFTSVKIASTNMVGLDASRISFDADNIYVNWQGLAFDTDTSVVLSVNGAVPEPASWALMIAGFGMVGASMRRRALTLV